MKSYFLKLLFFLLLVSFLIPVGVNGIKIDNPLKYDTFQELIDNLINFIFILAIAITPIMIVIGAFYLMTAAGNPERVEQAKKIILYTVVGLAIVLLARGLSAVIRQILGVK